MTGKLPPANIEAEEAILGGILLDPDAIERVVDLLHPDAFYVRAHKDIYEAALMLHRAGKPTDFMTVTAWLSDRSLLEPIGGTLKLVQLLDRTVSAVNIDRHAELVMDKYLRRSVICAGHEIVDLGYDTANELETILDQSEQKIFKLSNSRLVSSTEHNSAIALGAYSQLEENSPIYPTGFYDLDELMVGFEPGTLTLLAGRPSMGKSAISMNFALSMMLQHQLPVAIFSLEMTKKQLEYRLWSAISIMSRYKDLNLIPLKGDRIRKHRAGLERLTQSEIESIMKILEIALLLPLYINDSRGITVSGIASECRQIKSREKKLGLVVVDYLQMMAEDTGGNRSYELGDVARGLYKMAGDLDVPVLALSQISRSVESRQNKRPTMADLSQSGILEMVADNVLLAYRDEYYQPHPQNEGILELILAKARHGSTGTATVYFDKAFGRVKNLA